MSGCRFSISVELLSDTFAAPEEEALGDCASDGTELVTLEANKYESTTTCSFILSVSAEMRSITSNSEMRVQ